MEASVISQIMAEWNTVRLRQAEAQLNQYTSNLTSARARENLVYVWQTGTNSYQWDSRYPQPAKKKSKLEDFL